MIELVRAGRKPTALAREFGCNVSSIHAWVRQADGNRDGDANATSNGVADAPLSATERHELQELRRKLKQVQMERDILAKATAWFAGKSEKTFMPSTNS
jgi:transposase